MFLLSKEVKTRLGVDKVKPKVWFKYSLKITNRNSSGLFQHVLIISTWETCILVLPGLNLTTFMLKSYWVVGGGPQDFSVSPSPLGPNWVFELGWTGLGSGLGVFGIRFWGQGLTILPERQH